MYSGGVRMVRDFVDCGDISLPARIIHDAVDVCERVEQPEVQLPQHDDTRRMF